MDRLWLICKGSKNGRYCEVGFYCPDYEYMGVIVLEVFACFGVVGGSLIVQKAAVLLVRSAGVGDMLDWRFIDNSSYPFNSRTRRHTYIVARS
jgi:hypothetical protein